MNGESHIDGILLGYLPHDGVCEIKTYSGAIGAYSFAPQLNATTRAQWDLYRPLIKRQVRAIIDPESWAVVRIELNEVEEKT